MKLDMTSVRQRGLTVVDHRVIDLGRFANKHSGGSQALAALTGVDATLQVVNAHGILGELPKLPKKWNVGEIEQESQPSVVRDLKALLARSKTQGLFHYKQWWLLCDVSFAIVGAVLSLALLLFSLPMYGVPVLALTQLHIMWWVHDTCHNGIFRSAKRARFCGELASILFVGTPVLQYQYAVHRIHHGLTNVMGGDGALDTGPVIWDERMQPRSRPWLIAIQPWLWFGVFLPLTFPAFFVLSTAHAVKTRQYRSVFATAARWGLLLGLGLSVAGWVLLSVCIAAYWMALISSLNHFHLDKTCGEDAPEELAMSVSRTTQNLHYRGWLATCFFGGLNLHVEHHLFATMPRHNYPLIAAEVEAIFVRNGLPYRQCGFFEAVANLWRQLRRHELPSQALEERTI